MIPSIIGYYCTLIAIVSFMHDSVKQWQVSLQKSALARLEPYAMKVARTVLRG